MSRSADGATMMALLPPSSRIERPNRSATTGPTLRPIAVLPVALITGTRPVGDELGASFTGADNHLQQIVRYVADFGAGFIEQALTGQGSQRRFLGGLPDHAVAADHGQRRVPTPDGDREVER